MNLYRLFSIMIAFSAAACGSSRTISQMTPQGSTAGLTCDASNIDTTCDTCVKQHCCDPALTCFGQPECSAIVRCANACMTDSCIEGCVRAHPAGQAALLRVEQCTDASCAVACGGAQTQPTGDPTCLPDSSVPQDVYCPNMPNQPRARDCPGGSPGAGCTLSPTGAANVYCCPAG
jgi:hypothetical protein